MSKEQSLPANIQEQIERELPIYDTMSQRHTEYILYKRQFFLRGAEIALENQWIRVEKRFPEEGKIILFTNNNDENIHMGYLHHKTHWYSLDTGSNNYFITHWMPLPTPPKP